MNDNSSVSSGRTGSEHKAVVFFFLYLDLSLIFLEYCKLFIFIFTGKVFGAIGHIAEETNGNVNERTDASSA